MKPNKSVFMTKRYLQLEMLLKRFPFSSPNTAENTGLSPQAEAGKSCSCQAASNILYPASQSRHHIAPVVEPLYLDAEKAADRLYWEGVHREER